MALIAYAFFLFICSVAALYLQFMENNCHQNQSLSLQNYIYISNVETQIYNNIIKNISSCFGKQKHIELEKKSTLKYRNIYISE